MWTTYSSPASGSMETLIIATSVEVAVGGVGAGSAGLKVGRSAPTLMGIPSFSRRRVPMWKGFSY